MKKKNAVPLTTGEKRLLKLADHLEGGKLGHKKFYFGMWNTDEELTQLATNGCGYAGCAIGECPAAFKRSWKWKSGAPVLIGLRLPRDQQFDSFASAQKFFGLSMMEANHLFIPMRQFTNTLGGRELSRTATKTQVARNIRTFVKIKSKNRAR